jgi:large subunit ribosomal protein L2
VEYDPKRNSLIALIIYSNGIMAYSLATEGISVGDFIINSEKNIIKSGNSTLLCSIPVGVRISSIELIPNKGAQIIRSAGTYATIISTFKNFCILKLKSGEMRKFPSKCLATIGTVSNFQYMYRKFEKAGYYRLKGWLPVVRGVAMNPVDHPHGGGQGKTSGGRPSVTPSGRITKGQPTKKYYSPMIVRSRKS